MIAAVVIKPISVDIAERNIRRCWPPPGNRVVQVGTQRRSTPHLVEARERIIKGRQNSA